ncbi:MAG TPA: hypothetical protein VFE50_23820 [Cyclobacteriaceae bacterium]|nr:hypothetical protein [Cyclobacteriaceae bacterium]
MSQPFGKEFAQRVAQKLKTKSNLMYSHRDYCGTGLTWDNHQFIYCHVNDGYPAEVILSFDTEQAFIDWLAEQSDQSLSGSNDANEFYRNNQRITQARLFDFINTKPRPRDY